MHLNIMSFDIYKIINFHSRTKNWWYANIVFKRYIQKWIHWNILFLTHSYRYTFKHSQLFLDKHYFYSLTYYVLFKKILGNILSHDTVIDLEIQFKRIAYWEFYNTEATTIRMLRLKLANVKYLFVYEARLL